MPTLTPASVFRKYVTDGVPDSGDHKPKKSEIIQLFDSIFGVSRGSWVIAMTKAELLAVTPEEETDGGVVLNDPDAANNGYYERSSAAWVRGRGFPDTLALVTLGGTANAQTGTVAAGVDPATIQEFIATPTLANTGPMTLSVAGGAAKPVLNFAGNPLSAGEWSTFVRYRDDGAGNYRMTTDASSALAASQSASDAADSAAAADTSAAEAAASAALSGPTGVAYKAFAGDGTTTVFTLDAEPSSVNHILVEVSGLTQQPGVAYTVSGNELTFTSAPPVPPDGVTSNIATRIIAIADGSAVPPDASVTTAKLGAKAVTYAKIQDVSATDKLLGRATAGAGVIEEIPLTAAGRALIAAADVAAQNAILGAARPGTTTNDNAAAGQIGEAITGACLSSDVVLLTSTVGANIFSMTLTAGDWDISGQLTLSTGGAGAVTANTTTVSISTSSATIEGPDARRLYSMHALGGDQNNTLVFPTYRLSLAATTTVYFVARATTNGGTVYAFGRAMARRAR